MTRPISDLDVPLSRLQQDMRRLVARQRVDASVERLRLILAHPETAATPAPDGEQADYRHWLYDADPDFELPPIAKETA